ncbi:MAG: MBL fold metallo-hydrolase [Candidatus Marinimicrobia bacterium]|nr:MBL fold metallo-hydrolase [Candidatus Neomarinimicrobiota bacterium]
MRIKFWGVRGSIPTPASSIQIKEKIFAILKEIPDNALKSKSSIIDFVNKLDNVYTGVIGGNTSCIELRVNDKFIIFDMGTGIRVLGSYIMKNGLYDMIKEFHIFLSHTHWDHIMGFPFFAPAHFPKTKLFFYSVHPDLEERLRIQQDFRFFPVSLDHMASEKTFIKLDPESEIDIEGVKIKNKALYHPGGSYGFRVVYEDKIFVYATDSEFKNSTKNGNEKYIEFFKNADVLVFDAQYTFEEAVHKEDWGHSSALIGVDFSIAAKVKKLVLFHHEPERNDFEIYSVYKKATDYKNINYPKSDLEILLAYEGLTIDI